jgi:uncharacterized protein (TIGR02246 family)
MPHGVEQARDRFAEAWNGDDPAATASFFSHDATATIHGHTVQGRDAIEQTWLQFLPMVSDVRLMDESGHWTVDAWVAEGTFALTISAPDDDPVHQTGRYRLVWTLDADGQWLVRACELVPDEPARQEPLRHRPGSTGP